MFAKAVTRLPWTPLSLTRDVISLDVKITRTSFFLIEAVDTVLFVGGCFVVCVIDVGHVPKQPCRGICPRVSTSTMAVRRGPATTDWNRNKTRT